MITSVAVVFFEAKVHVVPSQLFWSSITFRQGRVTSSPTLIKIEVSVADTVEMMEEKHKNK